MNANRDPNDGHDLDRLLQQWDVKAPLPPRFQQGVWHRIEKLETTPSPQTNWLQRLIGWAVPRPAFAYVYVSAFLVAGIAAGAVTAQVKTSRLDSELSMRYLQSVDPYLAQNLQP